MIKKEELKNSTVNEIIEEYPYTESFFDGQKLAVDDGDKSLSLIHI